MDRCCSVTSLDAWVRKFNTVETNQCVCGGVGCLRSTSIWLLLKL